MHPDVLPSPLRQRRRQESVCGGAGRYYDNGSTEFWSLAGGSVNGFTPYLSPHVVTLTKYGESDVVRASWPAAPVISQPACLPFVTRLQVIRTELAWLMPHRDHDRRRDLPAASQRFG